MALPLPIQIGRYKLEQYLGGGMAEVYRATDTVLGRDVAFKQLTDQANQNRGLRERFLQEARLGSQSNHPNIVRTLDYGENQGRPFIVLDFLVGEPLNECIKKGSITDLAKKLTIALDIARGLAHVHTQKIVHRDIKPENIHVGLDGHGRLIDFGIAKQSGAELTQAGFVLGTPYYMPQEQLRGLPVSERTDIYAWALVLFEMFTGRKARVGKTLEQIMMEILNEPVNCAPLGAAGAPPEIQDLIQRCTENDPAKRPATFADVTPVLVRTLTRLEEESISRAKRKKYITWGATAAAALLAAVAGMSLRHGNAGDASSDRPSLSMTMLDDRLSISRAPISTQEYRDFCTRTGRKVTPSIASAPANDPAANVSALDAEAFCSAGNGRLPTEEEFTQAAKRKDLKLVIGGQSEWMSDRRQPGPRALQDFRKLFRSTLTGQEDWRVVRGGSFQSHSGKSGIEHWTPVPANFASDGITFRCARSK